CEVFGAYGWDVTLQKMKAVTDWLFSRGVNRLLLSSFYFTMEGDWQFEIPPSLFYQNTLWRYLPNYTDYVQRLSFILSGGRNVTPIAMLYPNKNVQAVLTPLDEKLADQVDSAFIGLSNFLLSHQLDFDYLDEETLNKVEIKQVEDKVILRLNQNDFWIDYELLLLPLTKIIDEAALQSINNFYKRGGKIIAYGNLPQLSLEGVDLKNAVNKIWRDPAGANTNENGGMAFFNKSNLDSIYSIIESCLIADLRLEPPNKNISFIHKIKDGLDIYFISNNDSVPVKTNISFSNIGTPQIWNAEDGTIANAAQFHREDDRTILPLRLDRFGSLLIVFDQNEANIPHVIKSNMNIKQLEVKGDSLFVCASPIGDGENFFVLSWQGKEFEKKLFATPPEKIDLADFWNFTPADNSFPAEIRSAGTWTEEQTIKQPDGATKAPAHPYFSGTGIYSQRLHLDKSLLKENRKFMLEAGQINDIIEVWLNGKKVGERCWLPFSFDITNYLKAGENEIKLVITNTPANNYMLKHQQYRLGENWGKIVPSGLMEKVKISIYQSFNIVFVNKE
ncbi:MAG: hypothetical protein MUC94_10440, partial [bacterium]|nr:hypothetical protein [bacterium]